MYIITVLTRATGEIEIDDAFNEELVAQNHYLDKVAELSKSTDAAITYESLFVTKTKAIINRRESGWTRYYKDVHKIVTLHHIADYDIQDAN